MQERMVFPAANTRGVSHSAKHYWGWKPCENMIDGLDLLSKKSHTDASFCTPFRLSWAAWYGRGSLGKDPGRLLGARAASSHIDFGRAELTGAWGRPPTALPSCWETELVRGLGPAKAWSQRGRVRRPHPSLLTIQLPLLTYSRHPPPPAISWPWGIFPLLPQAFLLSPSRLGHRRWPWGPGPGHSGAWDNSYLAWSWQSSWNSTCRSLSLLPGSLGPASWPASLAASIAATPPRVTLDDGGRVGQAGRRWVSTTTAKAAAFSSSPPDGAQKSGSSLAS